jgi:hypothetical protein
LYLQCHFFLVNNIYNAGLTKTAGSSRMQFLWSMVSICHKVFNLFLNRYNRTLQDSKSNKGTILSTKTHKYKIYMAWKSSIDAPEALHHIIVRGIERRSILVIPRIIRNFLKGWAIF